MERKLRLYTEDARARAAAWMPSHILHVDVSGFGAPSNEGSGRVALNAQVHLLHVRSGNHLRDRLQRCRRGRTSGVQWIGPSRVEIVLPGPNMPKPPALSSTLHSPNLANPTQLYVNHLATIKPQIVLVP